MLTNRRTVAARRVYYALWFLLFSRESSQDYVVEWSMLY